MSGKIVTLTQNICGYMLLVIISHAYDDAVMCLFNRTKCEIFVVALRATLPPVHREVGMWL